MAKSKQDETRTFPGSWDAAIGAFGKASEAYIEAWLDWQQGVARFVGNRFEENRRTQHSMSECQNWSDLARLQQDWSESAAKAYIDELSRLQQIMGKLFRNSPLREVVAETGGYEPVPRKAAE